MRVVIAGAAGRMGQALIAACAEKKFLTLEAALVRSKQDVKTGLLKAPYTDDMEQALAHADVLIDFTTPEFTMALLQKTAPKGIAHVIGTTGFSAEHEISLTATAAQTVIVKSGNMSLGVNVLAAVVERVARTLNETYDIEIVEMHHRAKVDAPSGTALLLGQAAAKGRGLDLSTNSTRVRDGHTGPRRTGDIGFATLRGGSVVGEHTVYFAGPRERLAFTHNAEDRSIFAQGALQAALWASQQEPARLYTMQDVLGL